MRDRDIVFNAVVFLIIVGVMLIIAVGFFGIVSNEENRITEGIILDKHFEKGYYHASMVGHYGRSNVLSTYMFLIEGEKDGQTVQYWMTVTRKDYLNYNVGDYFKK